MKRLKGSPPHFLFGEFPLRFYRAFDPTKERDRNMANTTQSGFIVSRSHIIYLAGPCFTTAELAFNRLIAAELEIEGHRVVLPQEFVNVDLDIRQQCLDKMKECSIMLCVLEGPDVDSGTAYEVGYWQASWSTAPVIGYRSDLRRGGDSKLNVNAMLSGMPIYTNVKELLDAINQL